MSESGIGCLFVGRIHEFRVIFQALGYESGKDSGKVILTSPLDLFN